MLVPLYEVAVVLLLFIIAVFLWLILNKDKPHFRELLIKHIPLGSLVLHHGVTKGIQTETSWRWTNKEPRFDQTKTHQGVFVQDLNSVRSWTDFWLTDERQRKGRESLYPDYKLEGVERELWYRKVGEPDPAEIPVPTSFGP